HGTLEALLAKAKTPEEKWKHLERGLRLINALQRAELHGARHALAAQKFERECLAQEAAALDKLEAQNKEKLRAKLLHAVCPGQLAATIGGGEMGELFEEIMYRIDQGEDMTDLFGRLNRLKAGKSKEHSTLNIQPLTPQGGLAVSGQQRAASAAPMRAE